MAARAFEPSESYRRFCRGAALGFALVAVYTLAVKVPSGDIERDWLHTALHLLTGAVAAYAGWIAADMALPRLLTVAILAGYGMLGVVGWFIDGLFLNTSIRIPLDVAGNLFHLLLAAAAATVIARARAAPAREVD
jgi:hypothetical protein